MRQSKIANFDTRQLSLRLLFGTGSIKEQMIRFVHRILNEENGISHNVFQCVIMGCNFQNSTDPQEKLKKTTTNTDLLAYGENYNIAPEQAS